MRFVDYRSHLFESELRVSNELLRSGDLTVGARYDLDHDLVPDPSGPEVVEGGFVVKWNFHFLHFVDWLVIRQEFGHVRKYRSGARLR